MDRRGPFRADRLDRFVRFVAERQRAWYRRVVLGEAPPWSADEVLRTRRFTNVYRVLDPGTQYAIQAILDRDEPAPDRAFNAMLYRLVGRAETHAHVGFQRLGDFEVDGFEAALKERRDGGGDEAGGPVFTGAYLVAGYSGYGGSDKVENVARLFGEVRDRFPGFWDQVEDASGPAAVYSAIRELPGFGNFLAYQVVVDLLYPLPPYPPAEWAAAGPGARRGLAMLSAEDADHRSRDGVTELDAMRWLWRNQEREFDRLDEGFVWLRDADGKRVELSLADVQNCCCEFYKWQTVTAGEGRTRRRFRPEERRSVGELRAVYAGYPISVDAGDYGDDSS